MSSSRKLTVRQLLGGAAVLGALLAAGYCVLVRTRLGHSVDNYAFASRLSLAPDYARFYTGVLEVVSKKGLVLAAGVLLTIAAVRRCLLVGVITVSAAATAIAGAEVLKAALPWRALAPSDAWISRGLLVNSYPSGHTTVATSLVLALLLVSSARVRPLLIVGGGLVCAAFATGVLAAGWHRPSDALGAIAWSGTCMSIAAAVATRLQGRFLTPPPVTLRLKAVGLFVALATGLLLLIAVSGAVNYVHRDWLFFVLTGLIAAFAFSLVGWYGWVMQRVEF
jgi:PAP2 superfamily